MINTQSRSSGIFIGIGDSVAFIIPCLMFIEVTLIGRLFLPEVILLTASIFLISTRGRMLKEELPRKVILLGIAWLGALMLTDAIRETPFEDWSRGWSKIIFLLLNFLTIYLYINGKEKRLYLFAAGIAAGQILDYFLSPNVYAQGHPWKFGYGTAFTLFVILFSQLRFFKKWKYFSPAIIFSVGILNFYMGFRSLGLICLLTGGVLYLKQSNKFNIKKIKLSKIITLFMLGIVSIYSIILIYDYGVNENWFGAEARAKYQFQSSGELGILLGGRKEILASSQAVIDSPIIGHGSWAKDPKYVDIMISTLSKYGYKVPGEIKSDLIPAHSYIMGAWVEAGFIGAIFWFWVLILVIRALIAALTSNSNLAPLIVFVAFNMLWNIPFSPFGAEARLHVAYALTLMMFALMLPKKYPILRNGIK